MEINKYKRCSAFLNTDTSFPFPPSYINIPLCTKDMYYSLLVLVYNRLDAIQP